MRVVDAPLSAIEPNPHNRAVTGIADLARSIADVGLLQPVLLSETSEGQYRCVCGHRRIAAVRQLGWVTVPAHVYERGDEDLASAAENAARQNLAPHELCALAARLLDTRETKQVAASLAVSPSHVRNLARVRLQLCDEAWAVFEAQGHTAKVSEWIRLSSLPVDLQRAELFGAPKAEGGGEVKRRAPLRSHLVKRRRSLPASDIRARVLDWVLGSGDFPEKLPANCRV